jgi:hypothetical protein
MGRRYLPVILPATLLLASAAAFGSSTPEHRRTVRRAIAAMVFMGFVGWQYFVAARTVARHVEYKGAIAQVAQTGRAFHQSRSHYFREPECRRLSRVRDAARL